ncbi:MAG: sn-glycerol-3-phosphate ABC transporter ATP-binding protein UgpC [Bacilli bacterium]|nr:sn-glycerol-3-phosphate ABC transporter ATP-binding protein UgpC [Bacilli bacterium]
MANLRFEHIKKVYPNGVEAVVDFNMEIYDREFIVLVGPSGCGKSTVLRMVAGLEKITAGNLEIDGVRVNDKPPVDRDIAMIFQDYALYGNMTVYENMGFSLTVRKRPCDEIHDKVIAVSEIVKLDNELNRLPRNLSGGQRQRVALGRSIVRNAKVFLMDEPLSNLDAKLRAQTRREIILLHNRIKPTIIYVTHDQVEAMTMATRIVVMNNGVIQQIGTPYEVYRRPANMFVAGFIGCPAMNFLKGQIVEDRFVSGAFAIKLTPTEIQRVSGRQTVIIGIRPEHLLVSANPDVALLKRKISGKINYSELLGANATLRFCLNQTEIVAQVENSEYRNSGETVDLYVSLENVHFFDPETEALIEVIS